MDRIIDLTETDDSPELLTSTTVSAGLLGGGEILATDPLETYLDGNEEPKYALRNKKAGVEIERDSDTEQVEPNDGLQAIALVTDVRLLVVVGRREGDRMLELPLSDVVEAKAEQGRFRTSAVVVTTVAGERWRFPCKTDVEAFASAVDELAQPWTRAQRLLDEAEEQVGHAEEKLGDSDIDRARDELEDAEAKVQQAVQTIREVGPAATARIESRAKAISDDLLDAKRELSASDGARMHALAQENWSQQSYETAAQQYERAIEAYESARSTEGPNPPDESLERRLRGAVKERELLRVGPFLDADAARRNAVREEDPEEAAVAWERALDGYRELLTLDWGRETREFLVDKDKIREQTVTIADDAIEDHLDAGQQWVKSGDRLAVDGHDQQAREVYERARSQFENARQLASEVRPEQLDDIEDALDLVEERLSGEIPDQVPDQSALDTVVISAPESASTREDATESDEAVSEQETEPARASGRTVNSKTANRGDDQPTPADQLGDETDEPSVERTQEATNTGGPDKNASRVASSGSPAEATAVSDTSAPTQSADDTGRTQDEPERPGTNERDEGTGLDTETDDSRSVLDQIRAQKRTNGTEEPSDPPSDESGSVASHGASKSTAKGGASESGQRKASQADDQPDGAGGDSRPLKTQLADLSEQQFTTLVSELWESQGWSTTVMSVQAASAFDIVALRERPSEERLGIWILYGPQAVDAEDVAACRTALADSEGAESATIVTPREVSNQAQTVAEEHGIAIVDTDELSQLLRFEGLTERVAALAVEGQ